MAFVVGNTVEGISGTGTESDPWVIDGSNNNNTVQNFLDAVQSNGGYILLSADIDASTDNVYKYGINQPINASCAKIYATSVKQDGSKYGINGLKVSARNFMYKAESIATTTFENISFYNCIFNKTVAASQSEPEGCIAVYSYPQLLTINFNNCQMSMVCNFYSYVKQFALGKNMGYGSGPINFNDTSIYLIINGSNSSPTTIIGNLSCCYRCCVQIDTFEAFYYNWGVTPRTENLIPMFANIVNSTILADMYVPTAPASGPDYCYIDLLDTETNSCFALSIHDAEPNSSNVVSKATLRVGTKFTNVSIMDKSIIDQNGYITLPSQSSNFYLLTTTQMKSESNLISIGFLP